MTVYRLAHELHLLQVPLIRGCSPNGRTADRNRHSSRGNDRAVGSSSTTGPVWLIGETTDIAAHVKIYQGVTLGALSFPKDAQGNLIRNSKRHPTIEEGVVIYSMRPCSAV